MRSKHRPICLVLLAGALLGLALAGAALAGAEFNLNWYAVGGGAGLSAGGDYSLAGSAGQASAGAASGGGYTVAGGFWGGAQAPPATWGVHLPLILK